MAVTDPHEMFDAFINGRLGKDDWTHEAHLITCWVALQDRSPADTLAFLRDAITRHNCGIGIRNDETSGYHETLTVYYVGAVHEAAADSVDDLFGVPACGRKAPLNHWKHDTLWSAPARLGFVAPDLAELPWSVTRCFADMAASARGLKAP